MFVKTVLFALFMVFHLIHSHDNDEHTIKYTEKDFNIEVPKKSHFIMFYAPWCGHCQRLGPTWEQLAEMLNEDEDGRVRIAKVDCTTDNALCTENSVTGYPTLLFFKTGEKTGVKFRGTRDLPTLSSFINEQLSSTKEEKPVLTAPEFMIGPKELNEENFHATVKQKAHFVKFYTPWCGYCQEMAPSWDELAKTFHSDNNVDIAKIDCTYNRKICEEYEIKGYPTLLWLENGEKVEKYGGLRTHESLKFYVTEMIGKKPEEKVVEKKPMKEEVQSVIMLTTENFEEGISKGISFVKFFAPWCGHCKRLFVPWNQLGEKFNSEDRVNIIKVDCTNEASKKLCEKEEIAGFPTLYVYEDGKKVSEYNGSRNLEDMYEFVMKFVKEKHDEL